MDKIEKFLKWYRENYVYISWFLVGWCCEAGIVSIERGDGISAMIDFGLAYANYYMWARG
jgi:hypothetical protein